MRLARFATFLYESRAGFHAEVFIDFAKKKGIDLEQSQFGEYIIKKDNKEIGELRLDTGDKNWVAMEMIGLEDQYQRKGIGLKLYQSLLDAATDGCLSGVKSMAFDESGTGQQRSPAATATLKRLLANNIGRTATVEPDPDDIEDLKTDGAPFYGPPYINFYIRKRRGVSEAALNEDDLGWQTTNKGLRMRVYDENLDYHDGQSYCRLEAYDDKDTFIGKIDYSIYDNEVFIDFIESKVQRKGIATKLMQLLRDANKGRKINTGMTTEDGTKFLSATESEHSDWRDPSGNPVHRISDGKSYLDYVEDGGSYFLVMVETDPAKRNQGVATGLLDEFFGIVDKAAGYLDMSGFLEDGEKYLTGVVARLKEKYHNIEFA